MPLPRNFSAGRERSAIMPLLYLAQSVEGQVSREGMREVGELLAITTAEVEAVASFYTMLRLRETGTHVVSVCTNLSCALVGAQRVVEAFEEELGVGAGETTEDGAVTLRAVECLGGCGYAPVVSIDERYRHGVSPEEAGAIVRELRAGG